MTTRNPRHPLSIVALACAYLTASFCPRTAAQSNATAASPAPKRFGTIYKSEVDGLINALSAARADSGALADGTALRTAQVLTAMGHSHRFYSLADGPVVRLPVFFLFAQRTADGSFGSDDADRVETTRWVTEALQVLDPKEHATEVAAGRKWLTAKGVRILSPWDERLIELGARLRREGGDPKSAGAMAATLVARGPIRAADGSIDMAATTNALLELVSCQALARQLDGAGANDATAFGEGAQRGFDYLLAQQEAGRFFVRTPDGKKVPDSGLTGMGLAALQTKPRALRTAEEQAAIEAGLIALCASQNPDGSFGQHTVNYTTCAAVLALSMADDPTLEKQLLAARSYILKLQNIEDRGYATSDRDYGSIGYGGDQRGDLSNLGFAVDALRRTGLDAQHEAFAKAITFLQRTQNLQAVNDFEGRRVRGENGEWQVIRSGDDGGAAYYPGNSPAGYDDQSDGSKVARSYGSMTYMLLRTYIFCGLPASDPRIQAAVDWIRQNWDLDTNPGSSPLLPEKARYQGLYYYYMVLAQALDAAGMDSLEISQADAASATSRTVDWREELRAALLQRQRPDGSWVNDGNDRWWEGQPTICTIYAMLALDRCARAD